MAEMIQVHVCGSRSLVNLNWVEEIREDPESGRATIYFAFNSPGCSEQDYLNVDESYAELVRMIWR